MWEGLKFGVNQETEESKKKKYCVCLNKLGQRYEASSP